MSTHHHRGTPLTDKAETGYSAWMPSHGENLDKVQTTGLERRVNTIEASDPERGEREGSMVGGVYSFLPCGNRKLKGH